METNVNHYSKEELIDVFELKQPFSFDQLTESAKRTIEHLVKVKENEAETKNLREFVVSAFVRLCDAYNYSYTDELISELQYIQHNNTLPSLEESSTMVSGSHVIINHTEPESDKNYTPDYTSGVINPLRKQINAQTITIHSKFRANYFSSPSVNYQYKLPNPINNVVSMRLLSAEIPNCIYNISSDLENNEFTIIGYDSMTPELKTTHTIKIRNGRYCGPELEDYLNKHVFTEDNSLNYVCCDFDPITCKFYFFVDKRAESNGGAGSGTTMVFDIDFRTQSNLTRPVQLNFGWVAGYRNPFYVYDSNYVAQDKTSYKWHEGYNPESTYNELATNYLLLSINDYNNNYSQSLHVPFQDGMMKHNGVLAKIQNPAENANKMILYTDYDIENQNSRKYFGPVNIDKLQIQLLDDMGRFVDINNSDYSISLLFETVYDL